MVASELRPKCWPISSCVGAGEVPVEIRDAVDDRGVALERHAESEAVREDRRDERPLRRLGRFLLDDRGEGDDLVHRPVLCRGAPVALDVESLVKAVHHRLENVARRRRRCESVGVGKQKPFELRSGNAGGKEKLRVRREATQLGGAREPASRDERRNLAQGEALGDGHLDGGNAGGEPIEQHRDLGRRREPVGSWLEAAVARGPTRDDAEQEGAAHDAGILESSADLRDAVALTDDHDRSRGSERGGRDEVTRGHREERDA